MKVLMNVHMGTPDVRKELQESLRKNPDEAVLLAKSTFACGEGREFRFKGNFYFYVEVFFVTDDQISEGLLEFLSRITKDSFYILFDAEKLATTKGEIPKRQRENPYFYTL